MIRPDNEKQFITKQAEYAFQEVRSTVLEKAKQTNTLIVVFANGKIQSLTVEEFEKLGIHAEQSRHASSIEGE